MFDLKGKKALVTGSTQGIGFAIAERLALQGAEVTVHGSKSLEKCEKAAAGMKANGVATTLTTAVSDLSKPNGADELYEKVGNEDILVLNAVYSAQVMAGIPAGFAGEAKDCAGAALLLCSEEGRYITGIDLTVDGGMKL